MSWPFMIFLRFIGVNPRESLQEGPSVVCRATVRCVVRVFSIIRRFFFTARPSDHLPMQNWRMPCADSRGSIFALTPAAHLYSTFVPTMSRRSGAAIFHA